MSAHGLAVLSRCPSCTSWGKVERREGRRVVGYDRCPTCDGFAFLCDRCSHSFVGHDPSCLAHEDLPVMLRSPREPYMPAPLCTLNAPREEALPLDHLHRQIEQAIAEARDYATARSLARVAQEIEDEDRQLRLDLRTSRR